MSNKFDTFVLSDNEKIFINKHYNYLKINTKDSSSKVVIQYKNKNTNKIKSFKLYIVNNDYFDLKIQNINLISITSTDKINVFLYD